MKSFKRQKGITLIALVITIIVLIILAGIAISMTLGENGIFAKAKEAKRLQITAEAKEKIGTEILAAQVEAIERNEELEQAQVEDIISKYGTLQDDKDTIILKDNGYEISLLDIYQGTTTSSGSYTENKAKIELLEGQVKRLQEQLDSMSQTGDEKDKKIAELNDKVTNIENEKNELQNKANELVALKENLGKVTATENQILKSYTAYKDGKLVTGTMANYAGKTVTASKITKNGENAEITIPQAGYYGTDSKISVSVDKLKNEIDALNDKLESYTSLESIKKVSGDRSAPITYTATEDMDCIVTIVPVGTGVGGGNYTTTITVNTRTIVSSLEDCFELNNLRSKFVKLKKGETITIINSGNPTTATDYHYMYNSMLYKMK